MLTTSSRATRWHRSRSWSPSYRRVEDRIVMKEVLDDIERWRAAGHRVAIARVVALDGSGPRDPGATMAVSDAGEVAGSVSGGCVEGAAVEAALEVLQGTRERGVVTCGHSRADGVAVAP